MRSCNHQQQATTTLPIAMDTINEIIMRRQSAHERRPSHAMRKAVAISLKATRQPCWQTQQGHHESVVSIMTILIPRWRILPHGCQPPQSMHNERKLQRFADQHRSQGLYTQCNDGNYCHHQHGQREQQLQLPNSNQTTTKNQAVMTRTPCITRATIAGQAANWVAWQSRWHHLQWQKNKHKQQQQKIPFC
jgi:hypothetical protein